MRTFFGFLSAILMAAPAASQAPARLVLADVVAEALAKNPEIAAAARRYDAARQRAAQERALPDPMVSAGWAASGNPLPGAGLGTEPTANVGLMISQQIPFPGKRDLLAQMATREAGELQGVYADEAAREDNAAASGVPDTAIRIALERQQLIGVKFAEVQVSASRC